MTTLFEKGVLAGIGLLSMTREKAQKLIDELSQEGEVQKGEVKDWVDQLPAAARKNARPCAN